eukprot:NODE_7462_length_261_cov_132.735849_g6849_i0.p1 GENE.NODE_7462_length_261_cov_132.735849_g6849_i0~~NODE_7462_length_261_cov_132.735849_g6849_i0.p1  ORF type:complete len:62 (-),score=20.75 NODE_7462_length_261_cov_132.735849_g6849_i0:75-236(-)
MGGVVIGIIIAVLVVVLTATGVVTYLLIRRRQRVGILDPMLLEGECGEKAKTD